MGANRTAMEGKLLRLSHAWIKKRDEEARAEYQKLWKLWRLMK